MSRRKTKAEQDLAYLRERDHLTYWALVTAIQMAADKARREARAV